MGKFTLKEQIAHLASQPDDDRTSLPPESYHSQELFDLECKYLFENGWVLVAREDQIPNPYDYLSVDVLNEPLVATRDSDGNINVLSRVCRHRWMLVCEGGGNAKTLVCPYHSWSYDLDGQLRAAPGSEKNTGLDIKILRLPKVRHEVWEGFIYVNLSGDATPINETLALAREQLQEYDLANWVTVKSIDLGESEWDWKVFMDNGEIYHHIGLHKNTVEPRSPARLTQTGRNNGEFSLIYGPGDPRILVNASDGKPIMPAYMTQIGDWTPGMLTELQRTSATYFYAFPNYVIVLWVNFGAFFRVNPLGPGRCHIHADYIVPGELADHPELTSAVENANAKFDVVHGEDTMACVGVQKGVQSRYANSTPLGELEDHNHTFARWYVRKISDAENDS